MIFGWLVPCTGANGMLPPSLVSTTSHPLSSPCAKQKSLWMLNPSPVHHAHKSQSRLILINTVGHVQTSIQLPVSILLVLLTQTRTQKKMHVFLSSDCMWYMCGCCWLKVVVVIAEIKMPGGGCVPLIPYLISRSRGEALNPEHRHTLTLLQTHIFTTKKHTCNFKDNILCGHNNNISFF